MVVIIFMDSLNKCLIHSIFIFIQDTFSECLACACWVHLLHKGCKTKVLVSVSPLLVSFHLPLFPTFKCSFIILESQNHPR